MINCKNCNKPFLATFNKGSEQKYCSVKCRQENAQKRVYDRIKEQVIGNNEKTESPTQKIIQAPIHNDIMDLKLEIEKMKYEQKLKEIENYYEYKLIDMANKMELLAKKIEEKYEYEEEEEKPNEFMDALGKIAPLIIEKLQKQS